MEYFKTNSETIQKDINYASLLNIKEVNEKHNELINKLQTIITKYESIINQIKNEILIEGENKINDFLNDYKNNSEKIKNEINELLKKLENNKETMNIKEFKNYFMEMSQKEDKLNNINKNKIQFQLTSEINNKINSMLNKIEKVINETMEDSNNPFNEYANINEDFKKIINKINSKNIEENKRTNKKNKTSEYKFKSENFNNY